MEITDMNEPDLVVYTNSLISCPYCMRAKSVLTDRGYHFEERDIADPAMKAGLKVKRPSARTVPQIFLMNDYYIGGCDDLIKIIDQLDTLIELNT